MKSTDLLTRLKNIILWCAYKMNIDDVSVFAEVYYHVIADNSFYMADHRLFWVCDKEGKTSLKI